MLPYMIPARIGSIKFWNAPGDQVKQIDIPFDL